MTRAPRNKIWRFVCGSEFAERVHLKFGDSVKYCIHVGYVNYVAGLVYFKQRVSARKAKDYLPPKSKIFRVARGEHKDWLESFTFRGVEFGDKHGGQGK